MRGLARVVRRLAVVAVLLALTASSVMPAHSLIETDRDCGAVLVGASRMPTVTAAAQASTPDEHCAFCHWHRAFGNANPMAVVAVAPSFDPALSVAGPDARGFGPDVAGLRPARAPPSFDTL